MSTSIRPQHTIINSDQGCQFTSTAWTQTLIAHDVKISMNGKGRCLDNVHIERFWKSLKYEEVYLKSYDTVAQCRQEIGRYINWYNTMRPHQSLGYQTPQAVYNNFMEKQTNDLNKNCEIFDFTTSIQNKLKAQIMQQPLLRNNQFLV